MAGRMIEYVDHLHEHFETPVVIGDGRYLAPSAPGAGTQMREDSIETYTWRGALVVNGPDLHESR
jgi:L-fuconate dehydratase